MKNQNYPIPSFKFELLVPVLPLYPFEDRSNWIHNTAHFAIWATSRAALEPSVNNNWSNFHVQTYLCSFYLTFPSPGRRCLIKVHELLVLFEWGWLKYAWNGLFQQQLPHEHKTHWKKEILLNFQSSVNRKCELFGFIPFPFLHFLEKPLWLFFSPPYIFNQEY